MNPSIAERRQNAAGRIESLRAQRGAAVLSGKEFDHAGFAAALSELEALTDAEAEAVRAERESQAAVAKARRLGLCRDLQAAEKRRIQAVDRAEKTAREAVTLIGAALAAAKEVAEIAGTLEATPPFAVTQTEMHIAERLAALIATLKPKTFGAFITLRPTMTGAEGKWLAEERLKAAAEIETIVQQAKG